MDVGNMAQWAAAAVSLVFSVAAFRRTMLQPRFAMKAAELQVRVERPIFWSAVRQAWGEQTLLLEELLDRAGSPKLPNRVPIRQTVPAWIASGTIEEQRLWRFAQTFYPSDRNERSTCDLTDKQLAEFKRAHGVLSNYYNVHATQIAPSRFSWIGRRHLAREERAQRYEV